MNGICYILAALILTLTGSAAMADAAADSESRTVIGPRNPDLYYGAQELLAGNAEEGVRLTELGLEAALGRRERQAGLSNMCAGHLLLTQYDTALMYCDQAILENPNNWRALCNRALIYVNLERYEEAESDLLRGEEIAPHATTLKEVRGLLLDATHPVVENIVIDDRRHTPAAFEEQDNED